MFLIGWITTASASLRSCNTGLEYIISYISLSILCVSVSQSRSVLMCGWWCLWCFWSYLPWPYLSSSTSVRLAITAVWRMDEVCMHWHTLVWENMVGEHLLNTLTHYSQDVKSNLSMQAKRPCPYKKCMFKMFIPFIFTIT